MQTNKEIEKKVKALEQEILEYIQVAKRQQFQRDFAIELAKAKTLTEALNIILTKIFQLNEFDSGAIYLIDKKTNRLNLVEHQGLPQVFVDKVKCYDPDDIRFMMIMKGDSIYQIASELPAPISNDLKMDGILALAVIPIKHGDNIIGAINLASHTHDIITNYSRSFIEDIAMMEIGVSISRIHAEEALRASEEKFLKAFHCGAAISGISDLETGEFIEVNQTFYNSLGFKPEEVIGKKSSEVLQMDLKFRNRVIARMKRQGYIKNEESIIYTKNGTPRNILLSAEIIEIAGKKYNYTNAIDITDRKQVEEEKRKALEFAAEQSKHALIGQVAGKMAHDFNNVLMGIMGNAQLAALDCNDEKTKEKLERIINFAERGRDITNNLISFSKDQEPKQTYFKIEDKIEIVLKLLDKDLAGIKVSRNYKSGIPELLADPGMIQDVLVNLIQNSIHAMSKVENPTLNLRVYSQNDKVYFEIEDNGCGIPKELQDSIYTPSFSLKGSHDKTGAYRLGIRGTGYGMSNVKKYIVEKHKGAISLESEVGNGTRITIALRIIKDHLSSEEKKEIVKSKIYDKRRILLVEDEPAIADVQYQILTKEPFSHIVSTAVNGQMAIDIFDRNKFDVISLDYMLPGKINGLDVYNHIREKEINIPVIFISGNIEFNESMTKLIKKDLYLEHLSKPVSNLEYVHKINELIRRSMK